MTYKLSEIKKLIENRGYGSKDELIVNNKGIRIICDEDGNSFYYDDFMAEKYFTLAGYHRNYNFNETDIIEKPYTLDDLYLKLCSSYDIMAILPLYLFEHSGIALSTNDFNDRWDSGQIGYVFMTKKQAKEMDIKDEKAAIDWINNGIKQFNRINSEYMYSLEFFEVKKCDCCNATAEINNDIISGYFCDDLLNGIIDYVGKNNIDIDA